MDSVGDGVYESPDSEAKARVPKDLHGVLVDKARMDLEMQPNSYGHLAHC